MRLPGLPVAFLNPSPALRFDVNFCQHRELRNRRPAAARYGVGRGISDQSGKSLGRFLAAKASAIISVQRPGGDAVANLLEHTRQGQADDADLGEYLSVGVAHAQSLSA